MVTGPGYLSQIGLMRAFELRLRLYVSQLSARDRSQQLLFAINKVGGVEGGELETVAMGDGVSRTGFDAVSAKDTAVVVDVVHGSVTFGAANAVLSRVLGSFDVNTVGRTGGCAQEARYTLLQSVFVTLQHVKTAKAFLEYRTAQWPWTIRIVLDYCRLEHLLESDRHTLGDGSDVLHDRHIWIIPVAILLVYFDKRLVGNLVDELHSKDVALQAAHYDFNNIGLFRV